MTCPIPGRGRCEVNDLSHPGGGGGGGEVNEKLVICSSIHWCIPGFVKLS